MISDFLEFLEYYKTIPVSSADYYKEPCTRILYDAVSKDGENVLASMTPYAHAVCCLCYREPDVDAHYNQKIIAEICCVSKSVVSMWKDEVRVPEKYRWFLLLVDISKNTGNIYGHKMLHKRSLFETEKICDIYLRMIGGCFDPFCKDDCILAEAVMKGSGIEEASKKLLAENKELWGKILKEKKKVDSSQNVNL